MLDLEAETSDLNQRYHTTTIIRDKTTERRCQVMLLDRSYLQIANCNDKWNLEWQQVNFKLQVIAIRAHILAPNGSREMFKWDSISTDMNRCILTYWADMTDIQ